MYCIECGFALNNRNKFCPGCGVLVVESNQHTIQSKTVEIEPPSHIGAKKTSVSDGSSIPIWNLAGIAIALTLVVIIGLYATGILKSSESRNLPTQNRGATNPKKYEAPDLLGFKIDSGSKELLNDQIGQLSKAGYQVVRDQSVTSKEDLEIISLFKAITKKSSRPYYVVESSYVRLYIDPSTRLTAIVRGETFVDMPYIPEFVATIKQKLNPPHWVVSALLASGTTPQLFEKTERETVWGMSNGTAVRFDDCFLSNNQMRLFSSEYRPGGFQTRFWSFQKTSFKELKPNYCQYAFAIHTQTPIYGDDRSDVIASYAVSLIDFHKVGLEARNLDQREKDEAEAMRNQLRESASKPKL